jgi:TolB-like protein/tetratricopeptide (TPR) repeat protein
VKDRNYSVRDLLREFRRRHVYRVGAVYLATAFVLLQAANLLLPAGLLGERGYRLLTLAGVLGLPVALVLAWAFDVTPAGIRRADAAPQLGRGLRAALVTLVLVATVGAGSAVWRWSDPDRGAAPAQAAARAAGLDPSRIAVLYFDDHSPARDLGYLADGLTEDLLHELAQTPGLKVASRNGVKQFRRAAVSPDSIVRALGVGAYIEGSVTRSGDWVRVTAQLIDGATGMHLSSSSVQKPMHELFALQDTLVELVSTSIRQRLGVEVRARQRQAETASVEAWARVQRATELDSRIREIWAEDPAAGLRALERSAALLHEAAQLDPAWHRPPLLLGWNAWHRARYTSEVPGTVARGPLEDGLHHAEAALQRAGGRRAEALELRGTLRFALARLSEDEEQSGLRAGAEADLRAATLDEPRLARAWWTLSELLRDVGRFAEARADAARALEEDAFLEEASDIVHRLFHTAFEEEDHTESQRWCTTGRRRFPDHQQFVICQLLIVATAEGVRPDIASARAIGDTLVRISAEADRPPYRAYADMQLAKVFARNRQRDSAHAAIARAHGPEFQSWLGYDEAHARLLLGEHDRALDLLAEYLVMRPDRREYWPKDWWLRSVWQHPRFLALTRPAD